jgi:hypothetical protein
LDALDEFAIKIGNKEPITEREAIYHRSIIRDIEEYNGQSTALSNCPSLHELLVYWNLNSKSCIRYFSIGMEAIVKSKEDIEDQLEFMRLQLKNINTLAQVPDFIYNPAYPSLKEYFNDYILNEIDYLENKKKGFQPKKEVLVEDVKPGAFKVLTGLSADQIGLFLRAAKDGEVLLAKSVSSVFNSIVPFLSTQKEEDLSANSVRVKSYQGEQRDKDILVEALQKIIVNVKEY